MMRKVSQTAARESSGPARDEKSEVTRAQSCSFWKTLGSRAYVFWIGHPLLALFLFAFSVRVAFILVYGPTAAPVKWGDDEAYDKIAYRLATQHEYINPWYAHGYPLFLALIYAVVGQSWIFVRLLQAGLGAGTCVLTCLLGERVFTNRAGIVAGLLLAIYPGHVFFSWRITAETLYMPLLVWSVLLALKLAKNPRPSRAAGLGVVVGFVQLVKSNLFPFTALLACWFAFAAQGSRRVRGRCLALFIAGFALVWTITPIANLLSPIGRASLLPGSGGYTLWFANNPLANGYFFWGYELTPDGRLFVERHGFSEQLRQAGQSEKDQIFRTLALLWIRENPGRFFILCLQKLNNAFGLFPTSAVLEQNSRHKIVHLLSYGPIASLAMVGLIASVRRWQAYSLLYAVILSYTLMVLIYFGTPRYTLLIIPIILVFAGHGATWLSRVFFSSTDERRGDARQVV
jgi:4-amino-4-deoxy-L-arabinose transferase-like glycosyltransferase